MPRFCLAGCPSVRRRSRRNWNSRAVPLILRRPRGATGGLGSAGQTGGEVLFQGACWNCHNCLTLTCFFGVIFWLLKSGESPRNHPDLGMFYGHFYCKKPTAQKSLLQAISKLDPGLRDFLTRAINLVLRGMLMDSLWTMLGQLVWSSSLVWLPEATLVRRLKDNS